MKKKLVSLSRSNLHFSKACRIGIAITTFLAVIILLNQSPWAQYTLPQYTGERCHQESSWVFRQGNQILEASIEMPAFRKLQKDTTYTLSSVITYDGTKDRAPFGFIDSHHMYCSVYIDGTEVFQLMPDDIPQSGKLKSPGNIYASFPLPDDSFGKEISIQFTPPFETNLDYELPGLIFGDYPTVVHSAFLSDLPHNLIAVLSGFMGFAAIICGTMVLTGSKYRESLFIGLFAIIFCIYNLTESSFNAHVFSNPYYTYFLNYTAFSLIPVTLIAFLRERLDKKQKPVATAMIIAGCSLFLIMLILHFTRIKDMREFLPILHISYFSEILIVFILIITMKKNRWKKHLVFQMIPIQFGMLLDAAVYYEHWHISDSDASFTTIGVIIFLIIEVYHVWQYSVSIYMESIRSHNYREMAYIDALTGIGNRRAFEAERAKLLSGGIACKSLQIVSADINNLKETNDGLGHAAGDFLIRSTADVLAELAGDNGHAFRVGGDEFIVILYEIENQALTEKVQDLKERISLINSNSDVKLSLALGWENAEIRDLDSAIQNADKKMYEEKARMKLSRSGNSVAKLQKDEHKF